MFHGNNNIHISTHVCMRSRKHFAVPLRAHGVRMLVWVILLEPERPELCCVRVRECVYFYCKCYVRDDAADESERVPQCVCVGMCDNNRGCVVCGLVCSGVKSTNRWCFGLIYSESRTGLHRETLTPPPQPKRR